MESYARGVRTGCHSCHKGDQNTLISLIATQASCRTRGSRVRQDSGWAPPNLPVVTRAPIVACGNGFVMRRRAIAFLCHVVSLFGYPADPGAWRGISLVRRRRTFYLRACLRRVEGIHIGRPIGLWTVASPSGLCWTPVPTTSMSSMSIGVPQQTIGPVGLCYSRVMESLEHFATGY